MKRCLNNITLGTELPFSESVNAASKAGFEGLEIFSLEVAQNYAQASSIDELCSMFDSLSIEPVGFVLGGFVYQNEAEFEGGLPTLTEKMAFASEIGARNALLFIPSKGDLDEGEALDRAKQRISETCGLGADHGLTIGLEPIGKADFLNTVPSVHSLMEQIDAHNLGLTIDIFHFFTAGSKIEDIRAIPGRKINLIHIDDAPDLPISELDDSKRVLPGQGAMDVTGFLKVLKDVGFDGPLSVELFNRNLWTKDPFEVAKESKDALDFVMTEAGMK